MVGIRDTIPGLSKITVSDICGLWEVFHISREDCAKRIYPWLGERFKYYFLDEMLYIRCRDGKLFQGTWGFSEKTFEAKNHLFLILDDKVTYEIVNVFADEMTLSDGKFEYYLVRKL